MPRTANPNKVKKGFMDGYKTYNPSLEGYGSPKEWKSAFNDRMGLGEAETIINKGKLTPWEVLGLTMKATWYEIRQAYKTLAKKFHPDVNNGDETKIRPIIAAYVILEEKHKRGEIK